ncbi:hypothetical protein BDU57DRAFT_536914 [Ampelomyces quisqualis]|uniref:Transcription factor CBF/NF-Y/archaeal histone domain-containing protein n=1 Tax=Ampelomyces quisqualis TaxID=50730 RepID=A0A6A5R1K5_AMPQU|nr:hypothetical protein BDU57DRAFT_536914 [Ampelomyces quisqualis]
MPYNNTPIAPSKEVTGHVSLPHHPQPSDYPKLSQQRCALFPKIINADPERLNVSKNAAFAIALATEMFIQHLATTTHNVVKAERKPRRNIQYRDVSSAIAKTDNLEFAVDVVPKTILWKDAKKKREEREERDREISKSKGKGKEKVVGMDGHGTTTAGAQENGAGQGEDTNSQSLSSPTPAAAAKPDTPHDAMDVDERVQDSEPEEDAAAMQLEMEMRGPPRQKTASPAVEAKAAPVSVPAPAPTVTTRRSAGGFTSINGTK